MLEYLIAGAICLPAFVLASRRSTWLVDYSIAVEVFNRGIRRLVDWESGEFNPFSMIVLTPLVVSGLTAVVVLSKLQGGKRFGPTGKRTLKALIIAVGLAFVVGITRNGASAVVELGTYLGPIGMLGYGVLYGKSDALTLRWARSTVVIGIMAAFYGIYQYYTIPPWDAAWVRAVGFEGYLGELKPTKMTLFSTLAERGPAATYFAGITIVLMLRPGLVGTLRWPGALLTAYTMLLTYSRTALVWIALAAVLTPIVSRGRNFSRLIVIVILGSLAGQLVLGFAPASEKISRRYSTLGDLSDDSSFNARLYLAGRALTVAATNPLGLGLGSQGAGSRRMSNGSTDAVIDATGYLAIVQGFGWIGAIMFFRVLWSCWDSSSYVIRRMPRDRQTILFRAWFVSGLAALLTGNWLPQASYFWLLAGGIIGYRDQLSGSQTQTLPPSSTQPA